MLDLLLSLLAESPMLFLVLMINLAIVAYIFFRLTLYFTHQKRPGKVLSHFMWKVKASRKKEEVATIEDVYSFVMESLRKEGALTKEEKGGLISRKNAIKNVKDEKKLSILNELFKLYEAKCYGNRRIRNEKEVVTGILNNYSSL